MRSRKLLNQIREAILDIDPEAEVMLFGSRARGEAGKESDWDFLILLNQPVTPALKRLIRHRLYEIEWETSEVISTIIQQREKWERSPLRDTPFHRHVSREAVKV